MIDGFKREDYVFIHSTEGDRVGNFEINKIVDVDEKNFDLKYPLTHTYKNDFQNHSQVIRIPQHSKVTIEKDVQLFHKAMKNGLGGVIAIMANQGFSIKGYIVDKTTKNKDKIQYSKVKKSKSGIIFGLANYEGNIARKVFDLKFTTRYPTITLPQDKSLFIRNTNKKHSAGKFQHITIPPDLNLHLTDESPTKKYEFFKPKKQLLSKEGRLNKKYVKLLSITYPRIQECPIFTNRRYSACLMIAFAQMSHWNENSHFTLELFALKNESVRVPIGTHAKGEVGVIHPFPCFYKSESNEKDIKYYLQPFIIMKHNHEDAVQIKFW